MCEFWGTMSEVWPSVPSRICYCRPIAWNSLSDPVHKPDCH